MGKTQWAALLALALLSGCATAKQIHTPNGQLGYSIDCSGSALNWGMCYEKAGEICGTKGYDIIAKTGDQGATVTGTQYGLYGGSILSRNLIIECKP